MEEGARSYKQLTGPLVLHPQILSLEHRRHLALGSLLLLCLCASQGPWRPSPHSGGQGEERAASVQGCETKAQQTGGV